MNPYALDSTTPAPELDRITLRDARSKAKTLASSGAAVRFITKKLQDHGVDELNAERIAIDAVLAKSRTERIIGLSLAVLGLMFVGVGYGLSYYVGRRIPVYVAMTGMFFAMLGFAKAFHPSKLKREPSNKQRLR